MLARTGLLTQRALLRLHLKEGGIGIQLDGRAAQ
jgi:hypothetical protein